MGMEREAEIKAEVEARYVLKQKAKTR